MIQLPITFAWLVLNDGISLTFGVFCGRENGVTARWVPQCLEEISTHVI